MEPLTTTDSIFFIVSSTALMFLSDPFGFVLFVVRAIPHMLYRVPQDVFAQRIFRPYDERPEFSRKASIFEWFVVNLVQWTMATYQPTGPTQQIFGSRMSYGFHMFRKYRSGYANLGDTKYTRVNEDGVKGFWIHSPTRGDVHDVVVYYIHGGGFARASTYFYMEYLMTLLVSLQLQGFRNPAIFALEYDHVPDVKVRQQLEQVANGWTYLTGSLGLENVVLAGDSNGGTLALTLLLHIIHPYDKAVALSTRQPTAAVVISPFTKLTGPWMVSDSDFVSEHVLTRYMSSYADDPNASATDPHVCPGLCRSKYWWSKAIPQRGGLYLMYGEDETLAPDVEELYQNIKDLGRVARDVEPNQVHSWPLVSMYIGRTKMERTRGIDKLANNIARMLLWPTSTEPDEEAMKELAMERVAIQRFLEAKRRKQRASVGI